MEIGSGRLFSVVVARDVSIEWQLARRRARLFTRLSRDSISLSFVLSLSEMLRFSEAVSMPSSCVDPGPSARPAWSEGRGGSFLPLLLRDEFLDKGLLSLPDEDERWARSLDVGLGSS